MYQDIPDHPVVAHLLATGEPDGKAHHNPYCPVCCEECDTI